MSVDFRIMAVKSRREKYILPMLKQLNMSESIVHYDVENAPKNPMRNARATWEKTTNCSHICVLQDDVEPCDNFREIVNICSENFPYAVFSFYNPRLREDEALSNTPYLRVKGCGMYGPAILMPTVYVKPLFLWCDYVYGREYKHDDIVIGFFCEKNNIPVMTTIPGIVQHLGNKDSFSGHNNKNQFSKVYKKTTDVSFFNTKKFGETKYIPNSRIEPKDGYKTGTLKSLSEIIGGME